MKYGYYEFNESPSPIEKYTDGAHIIVLRKVTDFVRNTCILEDTGWFVRDSIKVITETESFNATLFRKPFNGTVANNVLTNGCGGINIDATRISHSEPVKTTNRKCRQDGRVFDDDSCGYDNIKNTVASASPSGRFPANLILIHPNCQKIGVKTVKGTPSDARKKKTSKFSGIFGEGGVATGKAGHGDENGNEIIINYDCVADCPIYKLDLQSGDKSGTRIGNPNELIKKKGNKLFGGVQQETESEGHCYRDVGGASRYFKQVHSLEELKEYLIALIRC